MKKQLKFSIIAVFMLLASSAANFSFAEREGFEMVEESCPNNEDHMVDICRPNSLAKCDVGGQTLCPL